MISKRLGIAVVLLAMGVLGLGLYVLHLASSARRLPPITGDTRPLAPPVAGPSVPVTLFVANDNDGQLVKQQINLALPAAPSERGKEILRALLAQYQEQTSSHHLDPAAAITDVYPTDNGLIVVNANAAFADGHRSGILVEELTLASITQTLSANLPNVLRMKLLIEGKERATLAGHADLNEPFDVTSATRLVK
jgi:spore germination protein GerM